MRYRVALLLLLVHIGCDGVVGSPRVRDACGVCGGKNSTCQIISGIFTEPYLEAGYRLVVQIPAGACSIHIEELGATNNYLALRDIRKKFIINGDWSIDNSGTYSGAGASFAYKRQSGANGERITSPGPISEPVDIFILYRQANRGIKYEYAIKQNSSLTSVLPRLPTSSGVAQVPPLAETLLQSAAELSPAAELQPAGAQRPKSAAPPPPSDGRGVPGFVSSLYQRPRAVGRTGRTGPGRSRGLSRRRRRRRRHRFQWVVTGYSECSRTCGGGVQSAEVVCMRRKRKQLVRDRKCDPRRRPRPQTIACNTSPCPVSSWAPNAWSPCSTTCGAGHQTRTFLCVRAGRPVEVTDCVGRPTEPKTQPCNLGPCLSDARWQISEWSECSVSCGWGTRTRQVSCVQGGGAAGWCPEAERPRDAAPCRRQDCPEPAQNDRRPGGWMFTEWTEQCSVDCGQGVQWRGVTCGGGTDRCDAAERPLETRPCKTDRGCGGMWFSGPWSQCSRECGGGEASRSVLCVRQSADQFAVTGERACAGVPRPAERQPCAGRRRDCPPRWFVSEWAACSASCGPGSQRRTVACVDADGRRAAGCAPAAAPAEHRDCHLADCPKQASTAPDGTGTTPAAPPDEPASSAPTVAADESPALVRPQDEPAATAAAVDWPPAAGVTSAVLFTPLSEAWPAAGEAGTTAPAEPQPAESSPGAAGAESTPPTTEPAPPTARPPTARPPPTPDGGQTPPATELTDASESSSEIVPPLGDGDGRDEGRKGVSSGAEGRSSSDSCTDKFSYCSLVQQARLCKYKYYKNSCCATCRSEQ